MSIPSCKENIANSILYLNSLDTLFSYLKDSFLRDTQIQLKMTELIEKTVQLNNMYDGHISLQFLGPGATSEFYKQYLSFQTIKTELDTLLLNTDRKIRLMRFRYSRRKDAPLDKEHIDYIFTHFNKKDIDNALQHINFCFYKYLETLISKVPANLRGGRKSKKRKSKKRKSKKRKRNKTRKSRK